MIERVIYYCTHFPELLYLVQMKKKFKQFKPSSQRLNEIAQTADDSTFCFEALKKVSRSFSIVIQQLPEALKEPVCIFYLILRGLDTIEDDMTINPEKKKEMLLSFSTRINQETFILENIGDTEVYRDLMLHFDKVLRVYQNLNADFKKVITDIAHNMAIGMNKYSGKEVENYKDWDEYCHYVAGLVGIGLSELFLTSKIEDSEELKEEQSSNEMGTFLQKTNIIRDFAEDLEQGRIFWPKDAWKSKVDALEDLQKDKTKGLTVLNEVILNALEHIPSCLKFLENLKDKNVFNFCAIPQLMAIATLKRLYNNPKTLYQSVKIRKGKTARYFMAIQSYEKTKNEMIAILNSLAKKDYTGKVNAILARIQ